MVLAAPFPAPATPYPQRVPLGEISPNQFYSSNFSQSFTELLFEDDLPDFNHGFEVIPISEDSPIGHKLPPRKKNGRTPKAVNKRHVQGEYTPPPARTSARYHRSRETKLKVIDYLAYYSVLRGKQTGRPREIQRETTAIFECPIIHKPGWGAPTYSNAAEHFAIPLSNVQRWWDNREAIVAGKVPVFRPQWPQLETVLYTAFRTKRVRGEPVRVGWFRLKSRLLFRELYPLEAEEAPFRFSHGWFRRFLYRYNLSCRAITRIASRTPEEYLQYAHQLLKFIRKSTYRRYDEDIKEGVPLATAGFQKRHIINFDETPMPWIFTSGRSYESRGSKTVTAKVARSGWVNRQATVVIYLAGDGEILRPTIIFKATPNEQKRRIKKGEF